MMAKTTIQTVLQHASSQMISK